ncbi:hypothetical protein SteCoe_13115 [Stentor coeruleus]|uniref:Uncharacterized protein n=1 Tax=Stentor coeruleus TaxID=5963 RepID=A0A1R2C979_9CILI|nr:hypothetical protein SteCoe_13115 [Stentor coeruleus]
MQFSGAFWATLQRFQMNNHAIENLLSKDGTTLAEVLNEDMVIQEIRNQNSKLIEFMNHEKLGELLELVTVFPDTDADRRRTQNHPFIACEILCESGPLHDKMIESHDLMNKLFQFLDVETQHSTLLGYFSKTVIALLNRHPEKTLNFLTSQDYILKLLNHLYSRSIVDIVIKILTFDIAGNEFILKEQKLIIRELLQMVKNSSKWKVHFASFILSDILNKAMEINSWKELIEVIISDESLQILFTCLLSNEKFRIVSSSNILKTLFSVCVRVNLYFYYENMSHINMLISHLDKLALKLSEKSEESLKNTLQETVAPLGEAKLRIVELIAVSLKQDNEKLFKSILESKILREIIILFFEYPWHSILHTSIDSIVQSTFLYQNTTLIESLLFDSNFVEKMIESVKNIRINHRCGYLGHINRIANMLKDTENEKIKEHLKSIEGWKQFVEKYLNVRNTYDKKILGEPWKKDESSSSEGEDKELKISDKVIQTYTSHGTSYGNQEENKDKTENKTEDDIEENIEEHVEEGEKNKIHNEESGQDNKHESGFDSGNKDEEKHEEESKHNEEYENKVNIKDEEAHEETKDIEETKNTEENKDTEETKVTEETKTNEKTEENVGPHSPSSLFAEVTENAILEVSKQETMPEEPKTFKKPADIEIPNDKTHETKRVHENISPQNDRVSPRQHDKRSPKYHSPSNKQGSSPRHYSPSLNPEFNCTNFWKLGLIVDEIDDLEELEE